jgi:IS1 family transposase
VLTALAEGLGIRAVGRVFEVEPETVLEWLLEASHHMVTFTDYLVRELELEQVQMDELFGIIRAIQAGAMSQEVAIEQLDRPWLWTAMDPVSKFWLATVVGPRTTAMAQRLVHQVVNRLKGDCVPLFLTDGYRGYETALLSHYGQWLPPENGQRKARWMPLPHLHYVQVIKKRVACRLVSVSKRLVFGSWKVTQQSLAAQGWQVNTAFIERLNLSIRQHVSGLGRRVNTLALSPAGLEQQVALYQLYYNFCLPHAALKQSLDKGATAQKWQHRSPAMAVGLTDHIWTLGEVLSFRVPPWPQSGEASIA